AAPRGGAAAALRLRDGGGARPRGGFSAEPQQGGVGELNAAQGGGEAGDRGVVPAGRRRDRRNRSGVAAPARARRPSRTLPPSRMDPRPSRGLRGGRGRPRGRRPPGRSARGGPPPRGGGGAVEGLRLPAAAQRLRGPLLPLRPPGGGGRGSGGDARRPRPPPRALL